jgi:hypothetical protein
MGGGPRAVGERARAPQARVKWASGPGQLCARATPRPRGAQIHLYMRVSGRFIASFPCLSHLTHGPFLKVVRFPADPRRGTSRGTHGDYFS